VKEQRNPLGAKFGRRGAIQTGIAAAAAAPGLMARTHAVNAQDATPPATTVGTGQNTLPPGDVPLQGNGWNAPGILTEPQPLYTLPKDHMYHGGPTYFTNDFTEWHYISILGKNLENGHDVSIFWATLCTGWSEADQRPFINSLVSYHDFETLEFKSALTGYMGPLQSEAGDYNAPDFSFRYAVDGEESGYSTAYTHADETWKFTGRSSLQSEAAVPFDLDATAQLRFPGYVPMAYWGFESIGIDPQQRQNPETMFGLTYYYAGDMDVNANITIDGATHQVEGRGWFERQWGNFRNTEQYKYFWGYARLDSGDLITWRFYNGPQAFMDPHPEVSRFMVLKADGTREYAFGPAVTYTPTKTWESPVSGKNYPWWGVLDCPVGKFYVGPTTPEQESIGLAGAFIEGVMQFREGSPDGPVVGTGFVELVDLIKEGVPITRGLPDPMPGAWEPTNPQE
jgi:hypothetical protein